MVLQGVMMVGSPHQISFISGHNGISLAKGKVQVVALQRSDGLFDVYFAKRDDKSEDLIAIGGIIPERKQSASRALEMIVALEEVEEIRLTEIHHSYEGSGDRYIGLRFDGLRSLLSNSV